MIVLDIEQGTPEWMAARIGIPSASKFGEIVTTKGIASKSKQKYMFTLAGERVINKKEETYQSEAMKRGIIMEAEARDLYEMLNDTTVKQVGICYPNVKQLYACSPDGLVGDDGMVEIKCPASLSIMVNYRINGGLDSSHFQQLQGQLLVTGRKWVDIMAYYPDMKPLIVRVKRDEKFLKLLEAELIVFCKELSETENKLKGEK